MTDNARRLYGPDMVYVANPLTLYTVPSLPPTKAFIRDITFTNPTSVDIQMRMWINSATPTARIVDFTVPAGDTYPFRGLWVLASGESLLARQVTAGTGVSLANVNTATTTSITLSSPVWTPAANTLYLLTVATQAADAPPSVSSISGNGTWTAIGTTTSGSVAAANDIYMASYYWFSASAGSNASTTVTLTGTPTAAAMVIDSATGVFFGDFVPPALPTVPILQSATSVDTSTPASTVSGLTVGLGSLSGGVLHYASARVTGSATTSTPPTGFTELADVSASGVLTLDTNYRAVGTSATVGPNTFSASSTALRAAVALELAQSTVVNVMVNGVEVS